MSEPFVSVKRGVIIEWPGDIRAVAVLEELRRRGIAQRDGFSIEQFRDFDTDQLLVKIRTYNAAEMWLPIVPEGSQYPRWTLAIFDAERTR